MINFDDLKGGNTRDHNPNWFQIPGHQCRVIYGSWSEKTNALLNLINHQTDIDKIYLHAKDPYEVKYQLLKFKHENVGLKHFNRLKAFIEYSRLI